MKNWLWLSYIPLFLLCIIMFYIEVELVSVLPASQGGMTFWDKFKMVWYRSPLFYINLILMIALIVKQTWLLSGLWRRQKP